MNSFWDYRRIKKTYAFEFAKASNGWWSLGPIYPCDPMRLQAVAQRWHAARNEHSFIVGCSCGSCGCWAHVSLLVIECIENCDTSIAEGWDLIPDGGPLQLALCWAQFQSLSNWSQTVLSLISTWGLDLDPSIMLSGSVFKQFSGRYPFMVLQSSLNSC